MNKKNILRIVIAVLLCLVIIAVPLTVKFVGESLLEGSQDGGDIVVPDVPNVDESDTKPIEPVAPDEKPDKPSKPAKGTPIKVSISIEANNLFKAENTAFMEEAKKKLGDKLFAALNNGNMLDQVTLDAKVGDSAIDAMRTLETQYGVVLNVANDSNYIVAINGLGEKMAGKESGWIYTVNGAYVPVGVSDYNVKDGDVIEWHYTLNNGKDIATWR